jgi:hypothetical protein
LPQARILSGVEMLRIFISAMALPFLAAAAASPVLAQNPSIADFKIHIADPVYSGLPVWVQADLPETLAAHYPYREDPGSFSPNKIELRRDGQVVGPASFPPVPSGGGILDGSMAPPGSPQNRLPLHLMFSLDTPGTYSVRWTVTRHTFMSGRPVETIMAQSNWLTFDLRSSTPNQRELWLQKELVNIPTDPGLVAGDFLPSLMAQAPDRRVLRAVLDQLYSTNEAVTAYAVGCIYRFPDQDIHSQTMEIIRQRGPSERLAYFVSWRFPLFKDEQEHIVRIVLPYLHSADDSQVAGALRILIFLAHPGGSIVPEHPDIAKIADQSVLAAAPDLLNRGEKVTFPLAEYLGITKTNAARDLLWRLVGNPEADKGQALISLAWIADPRDLAGLGDLLLKPEANNSHGQDRAMLPYHLMQAYGAAAVPYLEKAIAESPYVFVRLQSAEQLVPRGSPIAFRFFLDTVNQNPFYKAEAIRWLNDQFPKDLPRSSDDATVIAFLKARLNQ